MSICQLRTGFDCIVETLIALLTSPARPQIIMNAVSNAAKVTPVDDVGGIEITASVDPSLPAAPATATAAPADHPAHRNLVIGVTDRGPGLRGQTLAQLLVEFGGGGRAGEHASDGIRSRQVPATMVSPQTHLELHSRPSPSP